MTFLLLAIGLVLGLCLYYLLRKRLNTEIERQKNILLKEKQYQLELYQQYNIRIKELDNREKFLNKIEQNLDQSANELARLEKVLTEKSKSFPWLAGAVADLVLLKNNEIADYLTNKRQPAKSSAIAVKEIGKEKRILVAQLKYAQYIINMYEGLFPFLADFSDHDIEEALLEIKEKFGEQAPQEGDPVTTFLTANEYNNLTPTERNQKALDRYMNGRKSSYQLGRDYERFIGYLYERDGYEVSYFGIENGKEDLGRDLICYKDGRIEVVQCKYWSKHKLIHEKHINQLFGTTVKFYLDSASPQPVGQQLHLFPELLAASNINGVLGLLPTNSQAFT